MRRCSLIFAGAVIAISLTSCVRTKEKAYDVSTIVLKENESIHEYIVEAFDETVYDKEELKSLIQSEIDVSCGQVSLDGFSVEDDVARVSLSYGSSKDYEQFNREIFYVGTFGDAVLDGYEFSLQLYSVKDGSEVSVLKLPGMQDEKICIWESGHELKIDGNILFFSEGIELINDHCAAIREGTYGYVIYE